MKHYENIDYIVDEIWWTQIINILFMIESQHLDFSKQDKKEAFLRILEGLLKAWRLRFFDMLDENWAIKNWPPENIWKNIAYWDKDRSIRSIMDYYRRKYDEALLKEEEWDRYALSIMYFYWDFPFHARYDETGVEIVDDIALEWWWTRDVWKPRYDPETDMMIEY